MVLVGFHLKFCLQFGSHMMETGILKGRNTRCVARVEEIEILSEVLLRIITYPCRIKKLYCLFILLK